MSNNLTTHQTIPAWVQTAFADWITRRLYLDRRGNYRFSLSARRVVPYNRPLKRLYPNNHDFHCAAHLWLTLWEAVPIGRLNGGVQS